jgi:hypothetical protein
MIARTPERDALAMDNAQRAPTLALKVFPV